MEPTVLSRILTAETLAFHIIWATIGVGVPVFISLAEGWGIWKKDSHYILMARRWTRGFVITVAVGVVTGTCIGLMLSLLWPRFMQLAGNLISLPLFLETFAFFFEAIFLGIYLYTWDRLKPILHWLTSIPIIIGSSLSAVFITTVNAFMNTPAGFSIDQGKLVDLRPLEAMFNPATPSKVAHVLSSAYVTCAFLLGGIAAWFLLKGRDHVYYKKALKMTMIAGLILALGTAVAGDISGKFLAEYVPEKLAAAEWHFETQREAPLILGGYLTEGNEIKGAIQIPFALSILGKGSPDGEIIGLNEFPPDERPPLYLHYLFDGMVGIGTYLILISALFLFAWWRKKNPWNKWILRGIVAGAPLSFLAIELGWIYAEVGRQPWIIRGMMRVGEAATTSDDVGLLLGVFSLVYVALAIIACTVLIRMFRHHQPEKELEQRRIIL
ncbi:cytochrome ubiquinol oxidase subunit I [Kroppenstedtia eburnea]|uniref:Cytochrome bd-I ubiquinol oxidase subunit 1 apoprotein n=1 Tax=Kroppenstedtia eburnea TaxID=714067 RepID=A0A1N7J761_9BACL|nr:cytochrome ubiquinol oxidase subunit I [Kroppenstedtia eburnea]EGK13021.1 cytochrome D ubiquinol oxidase subunit I [Desmospora sp. 8437]QKI82568.1 cytochrome ubiquinol oxidase subunit I [Kroppenstedtia eburnea]SIS45152.1 cytochrome bd-I ubiquinol oxidase subunit 1 apoprotein [Kroppenstedtia eburnea]